MGSFAFTLPQRNEISIEIDDEGFVEISQSDGSMEQDNFNVIRLHKTDLKSLIAGLQNAAEV